MAEKQTHLQICKVIAEVKAIFHQKIDLEKGNSI